MSSAPHRGNDLPEQPAPLKRLLQSMFWAGLVLCCALPAGCQKSLLQNMPQTQMPITLKEKTPKQIPQELEGLHVYLSHDLWVRNHNWSAFEEWKTLQNPAPLDAAAALDANRWGFGSSKENHLLVEPIESKISESSPTKSEQASGSPSPENKDPDAKSTPKAKQLAESEKTQHENWSFSKRSVNPYLTSRVVLSA